LVTGSRRRRPVRKTITRCAQAQARSVSRGVEDPGHAEKLHAREPRGPAAAPSRKARGRRENAMSDKTLMHGGGESYSGIVPAKRSNAGRGGPKEIVEGRR
jgi:hypothetical protein